VRVRVRVRVRGCGGEGVCDKANWRHSRHDFHISFVQHVCALTTATLLTCEDRDDDCVLRRTHSRSTLHSMNIFIHYKW